MMYSVSYASMLSTGGQAASFLSILRPALQQANLTTQITCCDGAGWEQSRDQIAGIKDAHAEELMDVATSHGYISRPGLPFNTTKRVWQTEWADLDSGFNTQAWWVNGSAGEGLTWALRIQDAFIYSNVSAFLGWIGAGNSTTNSALISLQRDDVKVSKRLWAFAQFSRFIRPGAVRVSATQPAPLPNATVDPFQTFFPERDVHVSAFRNPDGGVAVQVINNGNEDDCVQINGLSTTGSILRRYLTNDNYDLSRMSIDTHGKGGECNGNVVGASPAKSMVSFVIEKLVPIL